jgi:inner membrane transporter RhtA
MKPDVCTPQVSTACHSRWGRLKRADYSLMVSLLPATATLIGILVLAQIPSLAEVVGVPLGGAVALNREAETSA